MNHHILSEFVSETPKHKLSHLFNQISIVNLKCQQQLNRSQYIIHCNMQTILINNFKSYRKTTIKGFSPHINIILGSNGQGKSNFFKALTFALSDRSSLNQTELNACLHRGIEPDNNTNIEVEVWIQNGAISRNNIDLVKLAKIWTPKLKEQLYYENKLISKKQYQSHIETLSLSYSNPYNIIQQGKISQITLMDEFELFKLLEEVTGIKKFHKRKQEALGTMNKLKSEKQQIENAMRDISQKLQFLESRKEEFQFFTLGEKTKKYRTKKHLQELLEGTMFNLSKIRQQFSETLLNLSKIQHKKQRITEEISQFNLYISSARQRFNNAKAKLEPFNLTPQESPITQEKRKCEKALEKVQKKMKKQEELIEKKNKELSDFKQDYLQIEKKYEKYRLTSELSGKPKQNRNKVLKAYEEELHSEELKISQLSKLQLNAEKEITKKRSELNNKKNSEIREQIFTLTQSYEELKKNHQDNKIAYNEVAFEKKNKLQLEIETLQQYVKLYGAKLRKILPSIDLNLLDAIKQQKIEGVYGYFIDFLSIDENVLFAYEMAGLNKLCSLLVEDEEACNKVIKLNQRHKGKQINIIQMNYLRKQIIEKRAYPKNNKATKITNSKWIKPKASIQSKQFKNDLERLINQTFGNYVLVDDYQTGLHVSKQYFLNAITADRETIYAEGFLCKVGKEKQYRDNRIEVYYQFMEKKDQYQRRKEQYEELLQSQQQLRNRGSKLDQEIVAVEQNLKKIENKRQEQAEMERSIAILEKQLESLGRLKDNMSRSVENKKQYLKAVSKSNNKENINGNGRKIEEQYNQKSKVMKVMLKQIYELEENLQELSTRQEELEQSIKDQPKNHENNSFIQGIQDDIKVKSTKVHQMQGQLLDLEEDQRQINSEKMGLEIRLTTYEQEYKDLVQKIQQIGELPQNTEQQIQQMSNSLSISHLSGKKKQHHHHFSTNDKILFSKYSHIIESFKNYKITYDELLKAQENINQLITQYEREADNYMSQISTTFQKQFQNFFSRFVDDGTAEVRFKKVSEKIKNIVRYKNCLSIRVNFTKESGEAMKKWNDFSGGQKTIIAITILFALQRCEPAPFYIFDEVDSALDPVYVEKICQILSEESIKNNIQYFITSFKEEMLNFDEEICHYYLVKCENRVSNLEAISKSTAKEELSSIVVTK